MNEPCAKGHAEGRYKNGRCKACWRKTSAKWEKRNLQSVRLRQQKRRGLPEPGRPRPDKCELCGGQSKGRVLDLDHCHTTGKFRGWLCRSCNTSIGKLGDSVEGLAKATEYLQRAYQCV